MLQPRQTCCNKQVTSKHAVKTHWWRLQRAAAARGTAARGDSLSRPPSQVHHGWSGLPHETSREWTVATQCLGMSAYLVKVSSLLLPVLLLSRGHVCLYLPLHLHVKHSPAAWQLVQQQLASQQLASQELAQSLHSGLHSTSPFSPTPQPQDGAVMLSHL
jgi:hypothetical protein